jgi:ABC-type multidrug transport system permease subunit
MDKKYFKSLKIPFLLAIIVNFLISYILYYQKYSQIKSSSDIASLVGQSISYIPIMIISLLIVTLAGFLIVKQYGGNLKNAALIGVFMWLIQLILAISVNILSYTTIPGYRIAIPNITFVLIGLIISSPLMLIVDSPIALLGGFIAKKISK